jgi:hypothetical protein
MARDTPLGIRLGTYTPEVDRVVQEQRKQGYPATRCSVVRMLIGEALELRKAIKPRRKKRES